MFGKRKAIPRQVRTLEYRVKNGLMEHQVLQTNWDITPDAAWWRDMCLCARHLSDGDLSAILGCLKSSQDGEQAALMTSSDSANNDILGRFSKLGLAQRVELDDLDPAIAKIMAQWNATPGFELYVGKLLLEFRGIDPELMQWEDREQAELDMMQILASLTDEGMAQIGEIFGQFNNGVLVKQGIELEKLFETAGRALFAENQGIDDETTRKSGFPVVLWQPTALGSIMVSMQLATIRDASVH